jgi:hypothetical protein
MGGISGFRRCPYHEHLNSGAPGDKLIGWSSRRIFCEDGSDFYECLAVGHGSAGLPENLASKSGPVCESFVEPIPAPTERSVVPILGTSSSRSWSMTFGQLLWPQMKFDLRAPTGPFITAVAMKTKLICAGAFILSPYIHHLTRRHC